MSNDYVNVNVITPPNLSYRVDRTIVNDFEVDINIVVFSNKSSEFDPNGHDDTKD